MSGSDVLKKRALEIGFDFAGIAPIAVWPDLEFSRHWVSCGFGGQMQYLSNPKRADPRLILPSARSVICVGLVYNSALPYSVQVVTLPGRKAGNREQVTGNRRQNADGGRQQAGGGKQKPEGSARGEGPNSGALTTARQSRIPDPASRTPSPETAGGKENTEGRNRDSGCRHSNVRGVGERQTPSPEIGEHLTEDRALSSEGQIPNPEPRAPNPESRAWISRYAWGGDYHRLMREKLEQLRQEILALAPGTETRVYVDTGPIVERAFARFSGLGWMGKNTCVINEQNGSWFFLGVILSSLALTPDLPAPDRCGSCTLCIDACPTGALVMPYTMNASRCISYLTIEHRGSIPVEFRSSIGMNVFGCDICQDVCPWNRLRQNCDSSDLSGQQGTPRGAATTSVPEFQPMEIELPMLCDASTDANCHSETAEASHRLQLEQMGALASARHRGSWIAGDERDAKSSNKISLFNPPLAALASLSEEEFRHAFSHSPIKRAKYLGWLRNLCVVIGNSGDTGLIPWLKRACEHPDPMIREHATWALERLKETVTSDE